MRPAKGRTSAWEQCAGKSSAAVRAQRQVENRSWAAQLVIVQSENLIHSQEERIPAQCGHLASLRNVRSCEASVRR